ncbi:hypothetical protein [Clostridium ljungdahlii]|uniref:hypothetical protein n=1 Tax=Clostridium ljungdahlii TaxID=1538 RepID=UPI00386C9C85
MRSIKYNIILVISSLCILSLIILASVSYFISYDLIMKESKSKIIAESDKYSEITNEWIGEQGKVIKEIGDCIQQMDTNDNKKILTYLQEKTKDNPNTGEYI